MRRAKIKAGAMSAFALSAPLFNPLSLLYGVTLSRPYVILLFAFASLMVVTIVGLVWDLYSSKRGVVSSEDEDAAKSPVIGIRRLFAMVVHGCRQFFGPVGAFTFVAVLGVGLLAAVLPWGALGHAMERDDLRAPARMAAVAIPAYATPMLAMSQLGMMFQHANSPGAAFVLLAIGAGVNLGTLYWMARHFGVQSVLVWFGCLMLVVVVLAYSVNKPLVPPGVTPAGHTHAFDIYSNPIHSLDSNAGAFARQKFEEKFGLIEQISAGIFGAIALLGLAFRCFGINDESFATAEATDDTAQATATGDGLKFDRVVGPEVVGATMIAGLIAISVVMCYAFYPDPDECFKEIRFIRADVISGARSGDAEHAKFWIPRWDEWTRRMEVGAFLRRGRITPYQRMQGYLVRQKLETLEHELDHEHVDREPMNDLLADLSQADSRWVRSYREPFDGESLPADPFNVVILTDRDVEHSHQHFHGEGDAHDHHHDDFEGTHSHGHEHGHRHGDAPHGGRIISLEHDRHGAGARNPHLEVMPLKDGNLVIYPLRLTLGVFRTFREKPGQLLLQRPGGKDSRPESDVQSTAMEWDQESSSYRLALPARFNEREPMRGELIWTDESSSHFELLP